MAEPLAQEKQLENYLKENKKDLAVQLLFDLIVKNAEAKNFAKAEALREKLFEVDSMALNEIVKSAQIIEAEKIAAIDLAHKDTWMNLYQRLTTEEMVALYYGMETASYESDQIIFRQGQMNSNLYFINAGYIKMFYHKGNRGVLLKNLGPGDIAGAEAFFSNSICTTSAMAASTVKLSILGKTVLQKWRTAAPNMANKLEAYCGELESIQELLQKRELERREHKRYPISGNATIQILGGSEEKVFKGDISDISTSGASFLMNTSPNAAEKLLGCRLNLRFTLSRLSPEIRIDQEGQIVGVHGQMFNEYLINVKWDQPLGAEVMERVKMSL
jgi:CRP/FNR family transcriptional regulator, cyclic AMP receptor protein